MTTSAEKRSIDWRDLPRLLSPWLVLVGGVLWLAGVASFEGAVIGMLVLIGTRRGDSAALDVNGNRTFRVSQITVLNGGTLVLAPDDQAFYVGTQTDGQYPNRHTFVVLERVDPDA